MISFPNFPHISRELYFMGFKAPVFALLCVIVLLIGVISISIHLVVFAIAFIPLLIGVIILGRKVKKEQSMGKDNYLKSLAGFYKTPRHISYDHSLDPLSILNHDTAA